MWIKLSWFTLLTAWTAGVSVPAAAQPSKSAQIALPVIVQPSTATSSGPLTLGEGTLFGAQPAHFRSTAHLDAPYLMKADKDAVVVHAEDILLEYEVSNSGEKFPAYCTAKQAKPVSRLICFADRDRNGTFDQLWAGASANPSLWVPFPDLRYQFDVQGAAYKKDPEPISTDLKIGLVVYGGNIWTGQREFFAQLAKGPNSVMLYRTRATGSAKAGPATINVLNSRINLLGGTRKEIQVQVAQPIPEGEYLFAVDYPQQTIWIYVPG